MDTVQATWADFVALDEANQVQRALDVMGEVVAEFGREYVYPRANGCRYVHRDWQGDRDTVEAPRKVPSCLIGQVLHRLGLSLEIMEERDEAPLDGAIAAWTELGLARGTIRAFSRAQTLQDRGDTWGNAYDEAVQVQLAAL